jgi:transposase
MVALKSVLDSPVWKENLLMSLHPTLIGPVPAETARVAHAAFRKGNLYLRLRDTLGTIFTDADFGDLFAQVGQPALAPWRLALVCVFQFLEGRESPASG